MGTVSKSISRSWGLGAFGVTLVYQLGGASFRFRRNPAVCLFFRRKITTWETGPYPVLTATVQRPSLIIIEWNFGFSLILRIRACNRVVRSQIRLPRSKLRADRSNTGSLRCWGLLGS